MPVAAPISSAVDVGLPAFPQQVTDPTVQEELEILYTAIRSLQASIIPQYTTAGRPPYVKGLLIYDTTLGKLVVGGAAAWEVVTSV